MKTNKSLEYRYYSQLDYNSPEYDKEIDRINQEWHKKIRLVIQIHTINTINEAFNEVIKDLRVSNE